MPIPLASTSSCAEGAAASAAATRLEGDSPLVGDLPSSGLFRRRNSMRAWEILQLRTWWCFVQDDVMARVGAATLGMTWGGGMGPLAIGTRGGRAVQRCGRLGAAHPAYMPPPVASTGLRAVSGVRCYSPTSASASLITSSDRYMPARRNCSTIGRARSIRPVCFARRTTPSVPRTGIPREPHSADRLSRR